MSIVSSPATFTFTNQSSAAHNFSFIIPASTYSSAQWNLAYNFSTFTTGGGQTVQMQISINGSTFKDLGVNITSGVSASENITLVSNDHLGILNKYGGQTLTISLKCQLIAGSVAWTNLNITSFTLTTTNNSTKFAKKWSADALNEHVILSYIDNNAQLYTTTHAGLGALYGGSESTLWSTPTNLATYAEDVNLGTFTNGRCYLTYTNSDISKTVLSTEYVTNDQFGAGNSSTWTSPINVPDTIDPTLGFPTGGPFQPIGSSGIYVISHNDNQGTNYFVRNADRIALINNRQYQVLTNPTLGIYNPLVGPWDCIDQQGANWTWQNNSALTAGFGGYAGNYNYTDWIINRFNPNYGSTTIYADAYVGRQYNRVVGAPLVASVMAETRQKVLTQIVYVNRYSRIVPFSPNTFVITNNDAALGYTVTTPFTIEVPTDPNSNAITDAEFDIDWSYQERPNSACTVPEGFMPESVTIAVPAMGIPDPNVVYGSQFYLYLDFTFVDAVNFQIRIGSGTSIYGLTYAVNGRGEYNTSTQFYLDITDTENVWMARGGNITLPISYIGSVGSLDIKNIKFGYTFYGAYYFQGASVTVASQSNSAHVTTERDISTSTTSGLANNSEQKNIVNPTTAQIADIVAATGLTYAANLIFAKGSSSSQPSTPYPYYVNILDSFAVLSYNLSAYDFYMVRSRDGGRFWEFANNCQPITALANLKSYNALNTGSYFVPALVSSGDTVYAIWIEGGNVKCISTQDQGDSWST